MAHTVLLVDDEPKIVLIGCLVHSGLRCVRLPTSRIEDDRAVIEVNDHGRMIGYARPTLARGDRCLMASYCVCLSHVYSLSSGSKKLMQTTLVVESSACICPIIIGSVLLVKKPPFSRAIFAA